MRNEEFLPTLPMGISNFEFRISRHPPNCRIPDRSLTQRRKDAKAQSPPTHGDFEFSIHPHRQF